MSLVSITYVFTTGATIIASQHNSNNAVIYNDYNGNITDANIASGAGIEYTKLALGNTIKYSDLSSATISSIQSNLGTPSGGIIMWSGYVDAVPSGWNLCNGSNGTPNLSGMFIVAADNSSGTPTSSILGSAVTSGGSTTISINQMPSHSHASTFNSHGTGNVGSNGNGQFGSTDSTGGGQPYAPPFYALAFIMKS